MNGTLEGNIKILRSFKNLVGHDPNYNIYNLVERTINVIKNLSIQPIISCEYIQESGSIKFEFENDIGTMIMIISDSKRAKAYYNQEYTHDMNYVFGCICCSSRIEDNRLNLYDILPEEIDHNSDKLYELTAEKINESISKFYQLSK